MQPGSLGSLWAFDAVESKLWYLTWPPNQIPCYTHVNLTMCSDLQWTISDLANVPRLYVQTAIEPGPIYSRCNELRPEDREVRQRCIYICTTVSSTLPNNSGLCWWTLITSDST